MPRRRRYTESGTCYELCFRVRSGLPFAALELIDLLLRSAIARSNRGGRVNISHMVWMANHPHLLVRAFDAEAFRRFYMEVQKKITEYMKRLTGYRHLHLWEGDPQVAKVLDLNKAVDRIVYFYLNPARANLVESINEYPGLNTWQAFLESPAELDAVKSSSVPWIRFPMVRKLRSRRVTAFDDRYLTEALKGQAKLFHPLDIKPNDWMKAFGITNAADVSRINDRIKCEVAAAETELTAERRRRGRGVLGVKALRKQEILKAHRPKKHHRRNFVLASTKELRTAYIKTAQGIFAWCTDLYELACRGEVVAWPPGVFPPPLSPLANALG